MGIVTMKHIDFDIRSNGKLCIGFCGDLNATEITLLGFGRHAAENTIRLVIEGIESIELDDSMTFIVTDAMTEKSGVLRCQLEELHASEAEPTKYDLVLSSNIFHMLVKPSIPN